MFDRLSYTWSLMGASYNVLKRTKGLLIFPFLSGICCIGIIASFAIPLVATGNWKPPQAGEPADRQVFYYLTLFTVYFLGYTVITFFNVAVVAGAAARMTGGEPTVGSCLGEAAKRIHLIVGWALVSATVGIVLRLIEDRSPKIGQFVTALLGAAWTIASFLVVPALVIDNMGPITALKESTKMLRKTWGDQIVGNFGFGIIFFLLALPVFALIFLGVYELSVHQVALGGACLTLAIVAFISLSLVQATLQTIFQTALYLYTKGVHENGFPAELMAGALRAKAAG